MCQDINDFDALSKLKYQIILLCNHFIRIILNVLVIVNILFMVIRWPFDKLVKFELILSFINLKSK